MALSGAVVLPCSGIIANTAVINAHDRICVVSSARLCMKHGQHGNQKQSRESILAAFLAASSVAVFSATWTPLAQSAVLPVDESFVPAKIEEFRLAYTGKTNAPGQAPKLNDNGSSICSISPVGAAQQPLTEEVTNDSLIAEAWQVIYERFLDARNHKWSQDAWLKKREEVLNKHAESRLAAYGVIRNMLSQLGDPYSRFITPRELKQLSKYDMTGIGISLGETGADNNETKLRVVGVIIGSPAQMAGIKQGDELLFVNGIDVHGMSAFEASSLIQGHKGTTVSLQIRRELCNNILSVTLEHQQSMRTPVYYRIEKFEDNLLGYIHLKEFNAVAKRDVVTAINKMVAAGVSSILLDLRDNPGGLVQAGVEIAKIFLDEGNTILYTVSSDPVIQKHVLANRPPLTRSPLMVLVNEHTASASEIVAAALHDNCRAVLVGRRTFGKGLIQSVFELSDGSGVILTVGKYVTPNHQDIDQNGILPDFQNIPRLADLEKQIEKCSSSFQ